MMTPLLMFACWTWAGGGGGAIAQTFPTTGPSKQVINLVCIGDSITECHGIADRDKNGSPAVLARELSHALPPGTTVFLANLGASGTTTVDWAGPRGLLVHGSHSAEAVAKKLTTEHPEGKLIFSIMLGTNDSANKGTHGAPVSAGDYEKNLRQIIDELVQAHPDCMIFLHHPIWYSKNTHNSADYEGDSAHDRLQSYLPVLDKLADIDANHTPRHVYLGDTQAYDYFAEHFSTELSPQPGKNGTFYLHPNQKGAESLGVYWAAPIIKQLQTSGK